MELHLYSINKLKELSNNLHTLLIDISTKNMTDEEIPDYFERQLETLDQLIESVVRDATVILIP